MTNDPNRVRVISVVPGDPKSYTGCEYHRQLIPHNQLSEVYPCDIFQIDTLDAVIPINVGGEEVMIDELIRSCDFIHYGRMVDSYTIQEAMGNADHKFKVQETADKIHSFGKPIVTDFDDYWHLSTKHILKDSFRENKQDYHAMLSCKLSDHVTVTTDFLAETIKSVNDNVTVLPNAIDPDQMQWQRADTSESNQMRFGWVGGACHMEDFEIMHDSVSKLWHDPTVTGRFQIVLGGFNVNDTSMVRFGDMWKQMKVKPSECTYTKFERMLTDNYYGLRDYPNYLKYITTYTNVPEIDKSFKTVPYKREWAVDTYHYGQKYNSWDVTFIPLNDNKFNNCKSQLKMMESGFMGKACIVSGVMPYLIDAKHMVNAWVVPPNKNHKGWHKAMKAMINDRAMVKELSANLEKEMKEKYHINVVGKKRWELYCKIAGKEHLINQTNNKAA